MTNKFHTCEQCEKTSEDVEWIIEPYAFEMSCETEENYMFLCDECYKQNCDDI